MPNNLQDNIILDTPGEKPAVSPTPIPEPINDEHLPVAETTKIEPTYIEVSEQPAQAQQPEPPQPKPEPKPEIQPAPEPVTPKPEPVTEPIKPEEAEIPIEQTPVTPLPPETNPHVRKAPVSANPDVEGYLFNKSTIGGIDQSKLEYKETFKRRIYISTPSHRYSWVVLGVLIVAGIIGGIYYYFAVYSAPEEPIPVTPTTNDVNSIENPTPIVEELPAIDLSEELLKVQMPATTTDDIILKNLRATLTVQTNTTLNSFLTKEVLDSVTAEFKSIQQVVEYNTAKNAPNSVVEEAPQAAQE